MPEENGLLLLVSTHFSLARAFQSALHVPGHMAVIAPETAADCARTLVPKEEL